MATTLEYEDRAEDVCVIDQTLVILASVYFYLHPELIAIFFILSLRSISKVFFFFSIIKFEGSSLLTRSSF